MNLRVPPARRATLALAQLVLLVSTAGCAGREPTFERQALSIPMRDGVELHAVALVPTRAREPLPILLIRTPFGADREFGSVELPARYRELAEDGYIFVTEDIRGRFGSGGTFVSMRPLHDPRDSAETDESTDAWDTIDWLVAHLPRNNGKVGVLGISYRGWLAAMAGINPHPALRAVSPQGPMTDTWLGDDFFQQGAFRQTQGVAYAGFIELEKDSVPGGADPYAFYLGVGTLDSVARLAGVTEAPSWTGFRSHPAYDAYWRARALQEAVKSAEVPTLLVAGWWDQEDILAPELLYRPLAQHDSLGHVRLVVGPWFHGGWARGPGDSIGAIPLGGSTAQFFRDSIQRPWLARQLHGESGMEFPRTWAFETGANTWRTFQAWPPTEARPTTLYLGSGGRLTLDPPDGKGAGYHQFASDPAKPVPYVSQPEREDGWPTWLVEDQRFLGGRPDVVSWVSAPLAADLTIAGDVVAHLFASTTGTDADWVVKLIDVYPDSLPGEPRLAGYQLMVSGGILRGRYWRGFDRAAPIPANTVTPFVVDLHQQLYRFRRGHRVMVQVQSSWFPLYDRNPQVFLPNIFDAKPGDFHAQEHRVWHTSEYPSRVTVGEIR